jgi:hypothetical protein
MRACTLKISSRHRRRIVFRKRAGRYVLFDHAGKVNGLRDRTHRRERFATEFALGHRVMSHSEKDQYLRKYTHRPRGQRS